MPLNPSDFDEIQTAHFAAENRPSTRHSPRIAWSDAAGNHTGVIDRLTLVGSAPRAENLVVNDATVSRLHAELDPRKDGLWVRDLGSRNGTYVDGIQVTAARVPQGGVVRLGSTKILVESTPETTIDLWPESRFGPLVGESVAMRELFFFLGKVAPSDASVLLFGETGTGKELVARAIHEASSRAARPFIIVDCAALPEQLLESELFGHARGAFTGASSARAGAIESADGGTVFIDEIGELPLSMQPKLLRALESRTIRRLGEATHTQFDVRFISATHRDLRSMVNASAFREDLYFRLAVLPVTIPPLRERRDDLAALIERFSPPGAPPPSEELLLELRRRPWFGNVRELRNFVERATTLGTQRALTMTSMEHEGAAETRPLAASFEKPFKDFREDLEREYVRRLLARHGGNIAAAAQAAGLDRTYVYRLVRKHAR